MITVDINNKSHQLENGTTLQNLVSILGLNSNGIAFAIDNKVIKKDLWNNTVLSDGMKIIVIKAVCGG